MERDYAPPVSAPYCDGWICGSPRQCQSPAQGFEGTYCGVPPPPSVLFFIFFPNLWAALRTPGPFSRPHARQQWFFTLGTNGMQIAGLWYQNPACSEIFSSFFPLCSCCCCFGWRRPFFDMGLIFFVSPSSQQIMKNPPCSGKGPGVAGLCAGRFPGPLLGAGWIIVWLAGSARNYPFKTMIKKVNASQGLHWTGAFPTHHRSCFLTTNPNVNK